MSPLLGIVLVHVAIRMWAFSGIHELDELIYSRAAWELRNGDYILPYSHGVRYLLIVPLALSQAVFGVTEIAAAIPPFLYSLTCLLAVYFLGKVYAGETVGLLAAALWAVFPLDVIQATELHADAPLTAFLSLSVLAFIAAERAAGNARIVLFLLSGLALGLAHMAKEVGLVLLVFLVVRALWRRSWEGAYVWFAGGLAIVEGLEMLWFRLMTGNPLYRFSNEVWGLHYDMIQRGSDHSLRWMLEFPEMLLNPLSTHVVYFGGFFWLILVATMWGWQRRDEVIRELSLWWATILLIFNFAPLTLTFGEPLFFRYARTLHPIFVPGVVIVARALAQGVTHPSRRWLVVGCLLPVSVMLVSIYHVNNRLWAETARQAFMLTRSLPSDTLIVADEFTSRQLGFLHQYGRETKVFDQVSAPDARRTTVWIYDPYWIRWATRHRPFIWAGPPAPPSCPAQTITVNIVPAVLRQTLSTLTTINGVLSSGIERVLERWDRRPAQVFICPPGSAGSRHNG